jgi:hypothetical protein
MITGCVVGFGTAALFVAGVGAGGGGATTAGIGFGVTSGSTGTQAPKTAIIGIRAIGKTRKPAIEISLIQGPEIRARPAPDGTCNNAHNGLTNA